MLDEIKEKIKEKTGKKLPFLTPETEGQIREDERIRFARSFNFQCLFTNDEPPVNWVQWVSIGVSVITLIAVIWRT